MAEAWQVLHPVAVDAQLHLMKEGVGDAEVHAGVLTKEGAEVQQAGVLEDELQALLFPVRVYRTQSVAWVFLQQKYLQCQQVVRCREVMVQKEVVER